MDRDTFLMIVKTNPEAVTDYFLSDNMDGFQQFLLEKQESELDEQIQHMQQRLEKLQVQKTSMSAQRTDI